MAITQRWTTADLDLFPAPLDDTRYEIIDGELFVSAQPSIQYQYVCTQMICDLMNWNEAAGIAVRAPGLIFGPEDSVAPDVVWLSHETLRHALGADGYLHTAPELIAEVLSPDSTSAQRDQEAKLGLYSRQGVREYWIVDPIRRQVAQYRRHEAALRLATTLLAPDTLNSPLLPGFRCPVDALFLTLPDTTEV